jgi:hypothetical protein
MDDVEIDDVPAFEKGLLEFVRTRYSGVLAEIDDGGLPSDDLVQIIAEYKALHGSGDDAAPPAPAPPQLEEAVVVAEETVDEANIEGEEA